MNLAVVWNDLWQGDFAHVWYGIIHAHWSNVWAAISALFTALAVIVAGWAMLRWRKQDELKAKMAFKTAIAEYLVSCAALSVSFDKKREGVRVLEQKNKVLDDFSVCRHSWWMLEGLLDDDKEIKLAWDFIQDNTNNYINAVVSAEDLLPHCSVILSKRFVFK